MEESRTKREYIKPKSEVVNMELEQPMLNGSGSNWENGGFWG